MMPPDELATLSPSRSDLAATSPAPRFIILLGLLDAFGPLGIDMYLPAFPQIEHDLNAHGGAMQLTQVRRPLYRKAVARWKHYEPPPGRALCSPAQHLLIDDDLIS
jgi:hypothetical protein